MIPEIILSIPFSNKVTPRISDTRKKPNNGEAIIIIATIIDNTPTPIIPDLLSLDVPLYVTPAKTLLIPIISKATANISKITAIVVPGYNIATIAKTTAKTPKPILVHLVRLAIVFAIIPMPILSNPITSKVIAKMVSKKEAASVGR